MVTISEKSDVEFIKQRIGGLINYLSKSLKVIDKIVSERDKKINEIKEESAQEIIRQQNSVEEAGREIYRLFKANRSLLTDNGRKQVLELELGKIGIRLNRPSVWAKNIKQLRENFTDLGLIRFIKIKEEYSLDKIAMVAEPKAFKGIKNISITQKEVFFVQPVSTKKEYHKDIKRIRLN